MDRHRRKKTRRKHHWTKAEKSKFYTALDRARGETAETSVIRALDELKESPWFISVRKATNYEDHQGIDLFVKTRHWGKYFEFPIQIKSSSRGLRSHIRKNEGKAYIPGIIVRSDTEDSEIVSRVKSARFFYIENVVKKKKP